MAIVHLVFPILFSVLVCFTSKNNWSFMHKFRLAMLNRQKARKLFSLLVISLMLLLHYLYVTIFPCNWGVIMSSIVCAVLFSYKFTTNPNALRTEGKTLCSYIKLIMANR